MNTKTMIWAWPTRLFHGLLVIGFTTAYLLGEDAEDFQQYHFAFGALVGLLLFFRLMYGLFGPRYARFRDFPLGVESLKKFFQSISTKQLAFAGHNPAASAVMLGIFVVGFVCSLSGFAMYLTKSQIWMILPDTEFLEEAHEFFANLFLILVFAHLAGIIFDLLLHGKKGSVPSIVTGYKEIEAPASRLSVFQKFYSVVWLAVSIVFFFLALNLAPLKNDDNDQEDDEDETEEYFETRY